MSSIELGQHWQKSIIDDKGKVIRYSEDENTSSDFAKMYMQATGEGGYNPDTLETWLVNFTKQHNNLNKEYLQWSRGKLTSDIL